MLSVYYRVYIINSDNTGDYWIHRGNSKWLSHLMGHKQQASQLTAVQRTSYKSGFWNLSLTFLVGCFTRPGWVFSFDWLSLLDNWRGDWLGSLVGVDCSLWLDQGEKKREKKSKQHKESLNKNIRFEWKRDLNVYLQYDVIGCFSLWSALWRFTPLALGTVIG